MCLVFELDALKANEGRWFTSVQGEVVWEVAGLPVSAPLKTVKCGGTYRLRETRETGGIRSPTDYVDDLNLHFRISATPTRLEGEDGAVLSLVRASFDMRRPVCSRFVNGNIDFLCE